LDGNFLGCVSNFRGRIGFKGRIGLRWGVRMRVWACIWLFIFGIPFSLDGQLAYMLKTLVSLKINLHNSALI